MEVKSKAELCAEDRLLTRHKSASGRGRRGCMMRRAGRYPAHLVRNSGVFMGAHNRLGKHPLKLLRLIPRRYQPLPESGPHSVPDASTYQVRTGGGGFIAATSQVGPSGFFSADTTA